MDRKINKTLSPELFMQKIHLVLMLIAAVMNTSCTSFGANKVVSSHIAYNESVQLTVTREVLTNIVRSRYLDPMQFLSVSAINAQFSVNVGGTAGVAGIGQAGAAGEAGGSIGYSDSPTITFIPLSDNAFYNSLNSSFSVSEAVAFGQVYRSALSHADWQALSLILSFASINGIDDFAAGKYNKQYGEQINALVQLFQHGASYQQVPDWDYDVSVISKEKVRAVDMVWAFKSGLFFVEEDDGKNYRLAKYRLAIALVLNEPDKPEVIEALKTLGVTPGKTRYILRPPADAMPGEDDPYAIWVTPRSMVDVISLASHFVDVPQEHSEIVPPIKDIIRQASVISLVKIHHSKEMPAFPYRVQHRGYWYYIDDTDLNSRVFLEAMVAAYTSRVGSKEAGERQPDVVIPIGGG